ncbi:MAG: hypothetical protein ACD_15C00193G0014 [uncultured bacterium]|nr:MAG: hypothetical protein ACD_15C00193G0014 [uncultured bacterium]
MEKAKSGPEKVVMTYVPKETETWEYMSKKFKVSKEYLMEQNPHIKTGYALAGQEVKITFYTAPLETNKGTVASSKAPTGTSPAPLVNDRENGFPAWTGYLGLLLIIILAIACVWLASRLKKANRIREAIVSPEPGETREAYEARCRRLPKETLVACWYGCGEKVTAGHIVRHHGKCEKKSAAGEGPLV